MARPISQRILLGFVLLGFLAGVPGLNYRFQAEKGLNGAEILLDSQALSDWQLALKEQGAALPDRLIKTGISSLAFGELHLEDLVERGIVSPMSFQDFALALKGGGLDSPAAEIAEAISFNQARWASRKPGCFLLFSDTRVAADVAKTLGVTMGSLTDGGDFTSEVELLLGGRVVFVPLAVRQLRLRSLGFDTQNIASLAKGGFKVWIRPENSPGLSPAQISKLFDIWKEDLGPIQGVIFGGALNEAIGYPDELETTAEALKANGWKLGYIELPERAQQAGIEFLVRLLPQSTVRVMAVSPAHQAKLSPFRVLGMYSLGARERNIRVLYVRPFAIPGKPELDDEFLFSLPAEVAPTGPAATFGAGSPPPHPAALAAMGIGAGALALLLLQALGFPLGGLPALALLALPVVGGLAAGVIGKSVLYRALLALCVGMAGPMVAFLHWVYPALTDPSRRGTLTEGARLLVLVSLASLLTGLWVAALLPDTTFLLGLDRFRGVKILTLVTPVLIVAAFLWKHFSRQQWMQGLVASVKIYQALLMGALLGAFGVLLLRTGNEAGATASDSERYLRVVLDQALGVRPRFKEFLLAHPAMLCAPLVAVRLNFLPSLLMVLVAAIGQAGIVDTFAHVHTPLQVTVIRVVLGVVFGLFFGSLGYLVMKKLLRSLAKHFPGARVDVE